jgi:hypothetical protein
MYGWLWHHLPGSTPVRAVIALLLLVAFVAILFLWVFPWAEPRLPFTDVTVDESASSTSDQMSGLGWTT